MIEAADLDRATSKTIRADLAVAIGVSVERRRKSVNHEILRYLNACAERERNDDAMRAGCVVGESAADAAAFVARTGLAEALRKPPASVAAATRAIVASAKHAVVAAWEREDAGPPEREKVLLAFRSALGAMTKGKWWPMSDLS